MKRPWMPLYVGDFISDTTTLTATETGIYIRLLMHCWLHDGSIPLDDGQLSRIAHCDSRQWHLYKAKILAFFCCSVDGSTAQHKRVLTELRRCDEISNKRKVAAQHMHSKRGANAMQMHTQSQSQSQRLKSGNGFEGKQENGKAFKALPNSPEFIAWKSYFQEKGPPAIVRTLDLRELEGRSFEFEHRWPPGHPLHEH